MTARDQSHQLATIFITLCRLNPMARRMVFQPSESPWNHTALGVDSVHAYFMKRELYPINYPTLKQFKLPTLGRWQGFLNFGLGERNKGERKERGGARGGGGGQEPLLPCNGEKTYRDSMMLSHLLHSTKIVASRRNLRSQAPVGPQLLR